MTQPVVLITGASRGIGAATAVFFASKGWRVAITARTLSEGAQLENQLRLPNGQLLAGSLESTAKAIEAAGGEVFSHVMDLMDLNSLDTAVDAVLARFGRVDVLINNAGLGTSRRLVDMPDAEWHKVIDVTLTGTFRMTRAALQVMQPRGRGVIVNNASVLGWRAQVEQAHYAAAKAGVMALTRCAAMEAAEFGIRINAVAPSIAIHAFLKKSASEELLDELSSKEAFGRGAEPWEVANVMVMLASDYTSYMTGEVVSVSSQRA